MVPPSDMFTHHGKEFVVIADDYECHMKTTIADDDLSSSTSRASFL